MDRLDDVLSGSVGTLDEETSGQQVTVLGMVQRVYRHTTKKGNEMGFVTLEDMQGSCDVVVFPSIWKKTKDIWRPEQIVVVNGKVDSSRRDEPSLLCSWVKHPEDVSVAAGGDGGRRADNGPRSVNSGGDGASVSPPPGPPPPSPGAGGPMETSTSVENQATSVRRTVRVTLRRTTEQGHDKQRLREIHDLLTEYEGQDRFVIRLTDDSGKGVELRFPNQGTSYCPELVHDLEPLVGTQGVHVEEGVRT
jgi:hypothetical protein